MIIFLFKNEKMKDQEVGDSKREGWAVRADKHREGEASVSTSAYMENKAMPYQWLATKSVPGPKILLPWETTDYKHSKNSKSQINLWQRKDCNWILIGKNSLFFFFFFFTVISPGTPGWLSGWASPFGLSHDPGVLGSSPASGFPQGACFSLCLCLCLSLSLTSEWNILKIN